MSSITASCVVIGVFYIYIPVFVKGPLLANILKEKGNDKQKDEYLLQPREALTRAKEIADMETADFLSRLQACHQNMLEWFPIFCAACLFAIVFSVPSKTTDIIALVNIGARLIYMYVYMTGTQQWKGIVRSLMFFTCITANTVLLIYSAAYAPKPAF
jgi:uncharacterized MAPEG superfamily protein